MLAGKAFSIEEFIGILTLIIYLCPGIRPLSLYSPFLSIAVSWRVFVTSS
jgi:hypothetical protein